jgi:hypothetical protein
MGRIPAESLPPRKLCPARKDTLPESQAYPRKPNGTEALLGIRRGRGPGPGKPPRCGPRQHEAGSAGR